MSKNEFQGLMPRPFDEEALKELKAHEQWEKMGISDANPQISIERKKRIAELRKKLGRDLYPYEPQIFTLSQPPKGKDLPHIEKIEALEKQLQSLYKNQNPAIKYMIDPGTGLKWDIDFACMEAGLPPRYHTEEEIEQVHRMNEMLKTDGLKKRLSAAADKPLVKKVSKSR